MRRAGTTLGKSEQVATTWLELNGCWHFSGKVFLSDGKVFNAVSCNKGVINGKYSLVQKARVLDPATLCMITRGLQEAAVVTSNRAKTSGPSATPSKHLNPALLGHEVQSSLIPFYSIRFTSSRCSCTRWPQMIWQQSPVPAPTSSRLCRAGPAPHAASAAGASWAPRPPRGARTAATAPAPSICPPPRHTVQLHLQSPRGAAANYTKPTLRG